MHLSTNECIPAYNWATQTCSKLTASTCNSEQWYYPVSPYNSKTLKKQACDETSKCPWGFVLVYIKVLLLHFKGAISTICGSRKYMLWLNIFSLRWYHILAFSFVGGFIYTFSRKVIGFHRQVNLSELLCKKNSPPDGQTRQTKWPHCWSVCPGPNPSHI